MPDPDVTFVLPGLRSTGGIRAVFEIADHLHERGWVTRIQVPRRTLLAPRRSLAGALQRHGPPILEPLTRRIAPPGRWSQDWFDLRSPIEVIDGDLIASLPTTGAVVVTAYRTAEVLARWPQRDRRAVYLVQGYETWSGPAARVDRTLRAYRHLIVTAPWLAGLLDSRFGRPEVPVAVYGVDADAFSPGPPRQTSEPPVVGFAWDDRPVKGGPDLLAALERLRERGAAFRAEAFGIGTAPLPAWVQMAGPLSGAALVQRYRAMDLFVAAGRQESGPMSVLEAMACGVAVVSTDVGNVRAWSRDGSWARIVPPGSVDALADAIGGLLSDPAERERLAAGALGGVGAFGWDRTTDVVASCLQGLGAGPVR